ncbi:SDR family NAD(P)-dependent oxidoreductase [Flavitalea antarctica]
MKSRYYTLITGASEGLGKSFALECAARKHNLVLVALPGPELHNLSDYLQKNFESDVVVIEQDLSQDNSAVIIFNKICSLGIEINMLINNAGIGNTRFFEEESSRFFEKQIRINVLATTMLTHLFVPMLKTNSPSHILNVSSLACFFSLPKKQVYGGTKSFIYFFSRSLRQELAVHNVNVTVLCPGGINSNAAQTMLNKSGSWITIKSLMNPEEVAPLALNGMFRKKGVIIPGKLNRLFLCMDRVIPVVLKKAIISHQIGRLNAYRSPATVKHIPVDTPESGIRKAESA